jgi:hypothetical protein
VNPTALELDQVHATYRRCELILVTNRLAKDVHLNFARLARQLLRGPMHPPVSMEGVQESDQDGTRRPHPSTATWYVSERQDVESPAESAPAQRLTYEVVLDVVDAVANLGARVADSQVPLESRGHKDMYVFVDRRRYHRAGTVVFKERRKI